MPFTIVDQGTFTSTGAGVYIPTPSSADYFLTKNLTQIATTANPGVGFMFEFFGPNYGAAATPSGGAVMWSKSNSTNSTNVTSISSGGFNYITQSPYIEAAVTGTAITNANPAVVTMNNSYSNGDRVVLTGTTGMLQISGMIFSISSVSGTGFTLAGLDASGFAAPATAVTARRISPFDAVEPEFLYITSITKAAQAVVTVSQQHNYVVGQLVSFQIPNSFGMVQLNGFNRRTPAQIIAVTSYTFTINVNTSSYTTFAFPASNLSPTAQLFATVSSSGQIAQQNYTTGVQTGYNFNYVPFHTGMFVPTMYLNSGSLGPAGQSGDVIIYQVYHMESG